jgi:hypothetical protein
MTLLYGKKMVRSSTRRAMCITPAGYGRRD